MGHQNEAPKLYNRDDDDDEGLISRSKEGKLTLCTKKRGKPRGTNVKGAKSKSLYSYATNPRKNLRSRVFFNLSKFKNILKKST